MMKQELLTGEKVSDIKIGYFKADNTLVTTIEFKIDNEPVDISIHVKNKPEVKILRDGKVKEV